MADSDSDTELFFLEHKPLGKSFAAMIRYVRRLVRRSVPRMLPGPDGVWHWRSGVWTFRPMPQIPGRWVHLASDPHNPDHWWATLEQPISTWVTNDAGATWVEIPPPATETG